MSDLLCLLNVRPQLIMVASDDHWCMLQRVLQFGDAQKCAMFAARRNYLTYIAAISRRRQSLTQQLQMTPDSVGLNGQQLSGSSLSVYHIMQQLQECIANEMGVFMRYNQTIGHRVIRLLLSASEFQVLLQIMRISFL